MYIFYNRANMYFHKAEEMALNECDRKENYDHQIMIFLKPAFKIISEPNNSETI